MLVVVRREIQNLQCSLRYRLRVTHGREKQIAFGVKNLAGTRDVIRDRWNSGSELFEHSQSETFDVTREYSDSRIG